MTRSWLAPYGLPRSLIFGKASCDGYSESLIVDGTLVCILGSSLIMEPPPCLSLIIFYRLVLCLPLSMETMLPSRLLDPWLFCSTPEFESLLPYSSCIPLSRTSLRPTFFLTAMSMECEKGVAYCIWCFLALRFSIVVPLFAGCNAACPLSTLLRCLPIIISVYICEGGDPPPEFL